jgi:PAS domain S-box-containing protein
MSATELIWPQDSRAEVLPLFENSPLAWAQCDRQGNVTALNTACEQMLGISPGMTPSLRLADLVGNDNRGESEQLVATLLERSRESFQIEARNANGNSQPNRWSVWRARQINGSECILAVAENLPSVPAAEQRLRQAERLEAIGRLAGGVAHDFNNLLTGVLLYCDLLMASIEPGHRARKYADEIRKAGMQATGLVRQLLAVVRPANSQPRLLSFNEIAEGMRNLLVRLIGENIELQLRLDANLGLIKMDPTQAQQILLNLVLNARDAMPRGGQIAVETRNCRVEILTDSALGSCSTASVPCALFVVEDNGNGMDDSTRAHAFEPFFTTKTGKGTGLGLATVHDIVTTNGGLIHLHSKSGHGTRISVLLPLVAETAPDSFSDNQSFYSARSGEVFPSKEEE